MLTSVLTVGFGPDIRELAMALSRNYYVPGKLGLMAAE